MSTVTDTGKNGQHQVDDDPAPNPGGKEQGNPHIGEGVDEALRDRVGIRGPWAGLPKGVML